MERMRPVQREVYEQTPVLPFKMDDTPQVNVREQPPAVPVAVPVAVPLYPVLSIKPTAVRDREQLRLFVALLTVRFLKECNALRNRSREQWVAHSERLINQTLEGLKLTDGYCPDNRSVKRMCKSVVDDLQRKFSTKKRLEMEILEYPLVDAMVVQSMQTHIQNESTRLAEAANTGRGCLIFKCLLLLLLIFGGVAIALYFFLFWKK